VGWRRAPIHAIGLERFADVGGTACTVEISLGFLFKAFAATIEEKVAAKMQKIFAATA
jgi:hypothetical protein